ncbi:MAG: TolC family protein [Kiritimatiellaeota bacterium]|nr:TolC family protein [Kiritimatiellota bacterium]
MAARKGLRALPLVALFFACVLSLRAQHGDPVLNGVTDVLPSLFQDVQGHPVVNSDRARWLAQGHRVEVTRGFYDPKLEAGLLHAGGPLRSPDSFLPGYVEADTLAARGGVSLALDPGVHLNASLTHWQAYDSARRDGHAAVAGLSAKIPLLKDRGFETARLSTQVERELVDVAKSTWDATVQDVTYNIAHAYIAHLRAQAAHQESLSSSNRAARIYAETQERVKLTANAAYELHTARMEVALRTDDVQAADNARVQAVAVLRLASNSGLPQDDVFWVPLPDELQRWAALCRSAAPAALTNEPPLSNRPELRAAERMTRVRETQSKLAAEEMKSDLSLRAGVGWRLHDSQWGYNGGDAFGWEIGIVWSRPLGGEAERHAHHAATMEQAIAACQRLHVGNTIASEAVRARAALESALHRFEFVQSAVEEAKNSLTAEEERFRLGEGRTRNVLDAQKDLTNANLRSHDVAAELLRAYFDLAYARGQLAPRNPVDF